MDRHDDIPELKAKDGLSLLGRIPLVAETPEEKLDDATTPVARFFVRNNGLLPEIPEAPERWSLTVDGEVERPLVVRAFEAVGSRRERGGEVGGIADAGRTSGALAGQDHGAGADGEGGRGGRDGSPREPVGAVEPDDVHGDLLSSRDEGDRAAGRSSSAGSSGAPLPAR